MWATIEDLKILNDEVEYIDKDGILFFKSDTIKKDLEKVDIANTTFLQYGKKIHDITGYTTGIGVGVKEVFKLIKKKNAIRFNSDLEIHCESKECLKTISELVHSQYPVGHLDSIEEAKYFFCIHNNDLKIDKEILKDDIEKEVAIVSLYFIK